MKLLLISLAVAAICAMVTAGSLPKAKTADDLQVAESKKKSYGGMGGTHQQSYQPMHQQHYQPMQQAYYPQQQYRPVMASSGGKGKGKGGKSGGKGGKGGKKGGRAQPVYGGNYAPMASHGGYQQPMVNYGSGSGKGKKG